MDIAWVFCRPVQGMRSLWIILTWSGHILDSAALPKRASQLPSPERSRNEYGRRWKEHVSEYGRKCIAIEYEYRGEYRVEGNGQYQG